ncbi:hypothetical protein B0H67DRAFT_644734 [Lasiosphaeris hirsuta]|uniref:Uncharacterized protein n=1 Tax=Lasiosphaeris hirsuta TaxID=260670 RepID=A0AA40AFJ7_9PEZI|nr:hypothetical protein B0H67DRAFT_644734 [Lasiosphaeris hirsuta]
MDPWSITVSSISLVSAIVKASFAIIEFTRQARDAAKDVNAVAKELWSLTSIAEPLAHSLSRLQSGSHVPDTLLRPIGDTLAGCLLVVEQITKNGDMVKLRTSLETYKLALSLGLAAVSTTLSGGIKEDTEVSRNYAAAIKINTDDILACVASLRRAEQPSGKTKVEKWNEEMTVLSSYAETAYQCIIVDTAEYATHQNEDLSPSVRSESATITLVPTDFALGNWSGTNDLIIFCPKFSVAFQIAKRSWEDIPAGIQKPFATTAMCHIVELAALMGIYWKEFDKSSHRYHAEGNGLIQTGSEIPNSGIIFTFQISRRSQFEENRAVPSDAIKDLCCGMLPTIFTESHRPVRHDDTKNLKLLAMGGMNEIAEKTILIGYNTKTANYFRTPGAITHNIYLQIKALQDVTRLVVVAAFQNDKLTGTPGYSMYLLKCLDDTIDNCDAYLKASDRDLVVLVIREHVQEVLKMLNDPEDEEDRDGHSHASRRFDELSASNPEEKSDKFMDIYFYILLKRVTERQAAAAFLRRLQTQYIIAYLAQLSLSLAP